MKHIKTKDLGHMLVHHQRAIDNCRFNGWVKLYHMDMVVEIATELLNRYRQEIALLDK